MFVFLNQLNGGNPVVEDVNNIREFYPGETTLESGASLNGTVLELYRGGTWIVSQTVREVYEVCQKAKRGEL